MRHDPDYESCPACGCYTMVHTTWVPHADINHYRTKNLWYQTSELVKPAEAFTLQSTGCTKALHIMIETGWLGCGCKYYFD